MYFNLRTTDRVIELMYQALIFEAKSDIEVSIGELFTGKKDLDLGFGDREELCWGAEFNGKSM